MGRTIQLTQRILPLIIMINAGTGKAEASVGLELLVRVNNSVLGELSSFFVEFMNRFDGIIEFKPLIRTTFSKSSNSYWRMSTKHL